ncbi:unnamed protein product [Cochlearia groenlandica]
MVRRRHKKDSNISSSKDDGVDLTDDILSEGDNQERNNLSHEDIVHCAQGFVVGGQEREVNPEITNGGGQQIDDCGQVEKTDVFNQAVHGVTTSDVAIDQSEAYKDKVVAPVFKPSEDNIMESDVSICKPNQEVFSTVHAVGGRYVFYEKGNNEDVTDGTLPK